MSITGSNNPFACEPVVFANANAIVSLGTITIDGNEFTFSVGFVWKINGVTYQNTAPVVITIAEASTGFERIDNALLNTSNTIELQQGLESETIALRPIAPDTNIILTSWNISGTTIGETTDPILGSQFIKKTDNASYSISQSGTNVALEIPANGASMLFLTNAALVSVSGFSLVNITGNPAAEVPYNGKPFFIVNNTGVSIILNHDATADVPFMFIAVADIVVPAGGIIELRYAADGISEVFKSWSENVGVDFPVDGKTYGAKDGAAVRVSDFDIFNPYNDNFFIGTIKPQGQGVTGFILSGILNSWSTTATLETYYNAADEFALVGLKSTTTTAGSSLQFTNSGATRAPFTATKLNKSIHWFLFRNSDAATVADARFYVGLRDSNVSIGNVNPSTFLNCFGFGADSGDANINLIHNDATGIATKVDLGVNFPANTQNLDTYFAQFFIDRPNGKYYARIIRLNTGHVSSLYEITTNILINSTYPYIWRNNGTTALEVKMRVGSFLAAQKTW